ncbi:hypothetical protein LUZ60_005760 [Juncus effusus]|nr:hypothetical protein LUZ60_005760 [Juncus effusus]
MGGFWSQPPIKTNQQQWDQCKTIDVSKRLCMTSSPSSNSSNDSLSSSNLRLIPALPDEISLQILARIPRRYYVALKSVSHTWKNALTNDEIYQVRQELVKTEEWLYILTKSERDDNLSWHALDPINSTWQKLPRMPILAQEEESKKGLPAQLTSFMRQIFTKKDELNHSPFCGSSIGVAKGCLYILGGLSKSSALKSVLKFNPCTNSWSEVSSMIHSRAFCKTSVLNDKLYVVGGVDRLPAGGLSPLQSAEVYEPESDTWRLLPLMPFSKARNLPTAFLAELLKPMASGIMTYKNKLLVPQSLYSWPFFVDIGGEIFDPESNKWSEMPAGMGASWPARQAVGKLTAVVNGELYALEISSSSECESKIKRYDCAEDEWREMNGEVPFRDLEMQYLVSGFLGELHVVGRELEGDVSVMCADGEGVWRVVAKRGIEGGELVGCQREMVEFVCSKCLVRRKKWCILRLLNILCREKWYILSSEYII